MSRVKEVIESKHKIDNARRMRRNTEMMNLRQLAEYNARLYDELEKVNVLLEDRDIAGVIVDIPDNLLSQFMSAVYSTELASYNIEQDSEKPNRFVIRHKYVSF